MKFRVAYAGKSEKSGDSLIHELRFENKVSGGDVAGNGPATLVMTGNGIRARC